MTEWIDISLISAIGPDGNEYLRINCPMPEDGEQIIVTNGKDAWHDIFHIQEGRGVLESGFLFGGDVIAWKKEETGNKEEVAE